MSNFKYKAFISYSHADERWGRWLHRKMESFRLPTKTATDERLPRQPLRPVFRDRDELASASNLSDSLLTALDESETLIVICSSNSANSQWVNAEIEKFVDIGGANKIFALIVEDVTDTSSVFPPALLSQHSEPLAADIIRDGKQNALLKIVAGVLSLRFDELRQRHEQIRLRNLIYISAASFIGLLLTSSLAAYALFAREEAERARVVAEISSETAQQVTDFLVGILQKANPQNRNPDDISIREVLDNGYAMAKSKLATQPRVRAAVLQSIFKTYNTLGLFTKNVEIMKDVQEALQQDDGAAPREIARAMVNLAGAVSSLDTPEANAEAEEKYLAAIEYLGTFEETDHYLVGTAYIGLGTLYQYLPGRFDEAVGFYERAITHFNSLPEPNYVKLSWAYQNLGSSYLNKGDLEKAHEYLTVAESQAMDNAADDFALLSTIRLNLAETLLKLGNLDEAFERLRIAQDALISVLGKSHPRVVFATRLLGSVAHLRGELDLAERLFRDALERAKGVEGGSKNKLLGIVTTYLGDLAVTRNQPVEANHLYRRALSYLEKDTEAADPRSVLEEWGIDSFPLPH